MRTTAWFLRAPGDGDRPLQLFCFPYAGGSAGMFRDWLSAFGAGIEVIGVELPGRGARRSERPFVDLPSLIEAVADAIESMLHRPFVFFGHSMGALIAYELARRLRATSGIEPLRLFVSGFRAPHLPNLNAQIHALPDDELIAELRRLNGTPEQFLDDPEIMRLLIPSLRTDFAICETYRYSEAAPLSCPILAFGGLDDAEVRREAIAAWQVHSVGAFSLHMLPGDHFFIHSAMPSVHYVLLREMLLIGARQDHPVTA